MNNRIMTVLGLCAIVAAADAAVSIKWRVATEDAEVAAFDCYRGETLALEAALKSYGKPFETDVQPMLYWQTNGMGTAFWSAPATVSSNVMSAVWLPSYDVGASVYNCFIGAPGEIYRAAFKLRMHGSPGATPNTLQPPVRVLDFAAITVENAPWTTYAVKIVSATNDLSETLSAAIASGDAATLDAAKAYTDANAGGVDTNAVRDIAGEVADAKLGPYAKSADVYTKKTDVAIDNASIKIGNSGVGTTFFYDGVMVNGVGGFQSRWLEWPAVPGRLATQGDIPDVSGKADAADVTALGTQISQAYIYSEATYQYMNGNSTNCWLEGTNYVTDAAIRAQRTRFVWEDGMDPTTVPCSMALWEIRDGVRQKVWDQRDWNVWYWNLKAAQINERINATNASIVARINALDASMPSKAWSTYTASGLTNPVQNTTWVDTPKIQLAAGYAWQSVAEVGGCTYWTIVGNGAIGNAAGTTNAVFEIRDFEGNSVLRIKKGGKQLLPVLKEHNIIRGPSMYDSEGRVVFELHLPDGATDEHPTGYFGLDLEAQELWPSDESDDCPALVEWEKVDTRVYRCHFIAQPALLSAECFARFAFESEQQTVIEYNAGQVINGGLIFNGVKIKPDIAVGASPSAGTVIQWKVVQ